MSDMTPEPDHSRPMDPALRAELDAMRAARRASLRVPVPVRERPVITPRRQAALDRSREIKAALKPEATRCHAPQRKPRAPLDHALVMRMVGDGLTRKEVAERVGCAPQTVDALIRKYRDGRPVPGLTPPLFNVDAAAADLQAGMTCQAVAKKHGVTRSQMRAPLRRLGLVL
jgi:transposase-like protein